jgi:cytosine/adenosine deaminase-related metal-dependent hydrolase
MLGGIVPPTSLKLDHARYVLTLDALRRIIRDGSILTEAGRITRVGKADDLADAQADRVIDARDLVVAPGFVNAHMHISYAHPVRGLFPDDLGSPLVHVFAFQAAVTEEEYHTSLLALVELARSRTVCLLDPGSTKFPDACLQAYQDAGLRVVPGEGVTDGEAPWTLSRYATADAVRCTERFIDKWNGRLDGRLRAWPCPSHRRPVAPSPCALSSASPTSGGPASRSTYALDDLSRYCPAPQPRTMRY